MKPHEFNEDDLNSPAQRQMQDLVSHLPEDTLSMAWRSSLNEKLLATAPKPKRSVWSWLMKPAVGLGFAGALAVVLLVRTDVMAPVATPTPSNGALEAALVRDHRDLVHMTDVVGAGLIPDESTPSQSYSVDNEWSDVDLDSL